MLALSLRQGLINGKRIFSDTSFRKLQFKNFSRDLKWNCGAGGLIFFVGDIAAQEIHKTVKYRDNVNLRRSFAIAIQGVVLNGVLLTPLYRFLDVLYGDSQKLKKFWPAIPIKIMIIQVFFMPISTALFVILTPILHLMLKTGVSIGPSNNEKGMYGALKDGYFQLKLSFMDMYLISWTLWPLSDTINLWYIPVAYRPLWDSVIDIFWTAYLSYTCHTEKQ